MGWINYERVENEPRIYLTSFMMGIPRPTLVMGSIQMGKITVLTLFFSLFLAILASKSPRLDGPTDLELDFSRKLNDYHKSEDLTGIEDLFLTYGMYMLQACHQHKLLLKQTLWDIAAAVECLEFYYKAPLVDELEGRSRVGLRTAAQFACLRGKNPVPLQISDEEWHNLINQ